MSFRTDATDAAIGELGSALFASMRRADQRARGRAYLQGLLRAEGRKSIRGIAAAAGSAATQQRLHHFVSESTWDWSLVRRALAGYLTDRLPPLAWVLHPLLIPKQGTQSVGVSRHFEARLGHTTTAQQAAGLWAVTDEVSYPVQWRLHLSGEWLTDRALRHRMAIPEDLPAETFGTGNVSAFLEAARWPEWVSRPLVLDVRHPELASTVHRLRAAGAPFLARISAHTPLLAGGPADTTDPMPAGAVMAAARHRRRPVSWTEPGTVPVARSRLAATAPVRLPGEGPESGTELLLLGTAGPGPGVAGRAVADRPHRHPAGRPGADDRPDGPGRAGPGRGHRPPRAAGLHRPLVRRLAPARHARVRGARAGRADRPARGSPAGDPAHRLSAYSSS